MDQVGKNTSDKPNADQAPVRAGAASGQNWDQLIHEEAEFRRREEHSPKSLDETVQYALDESTKAFALSDSARQNAELARNKAEDARQEAEIARSRAENAREEAEYSRRDAELARRESETHTNLLEKILTEAVRARQLAENALETAEIARMNAKLAEERYKLVLWGSDDGIWDWDIQKDTIYWNGRFFKMLGFLETGVPPTNEVLFDRIHPEDKQRVKDTINHAIDLHQHFQGTFRIKNTEGHYLQCLVRGKTLLDETGQPIRMAGTITDISDSTHRGKPKPAKPRT